MGSKVELVTEGSSKIQMGQQLGQFYLVKVDLIYELIIICGFPTLHLIFPILYCFPNGK